MYDPLIIQISKQKIMSIISFCVYQNYCSFTNTIYGIIKGWWGSPSEVFLAEVLGLIIQNHALSKIYNY